MKLPALDHNRPHDSFQDGDFAYEVAVWPAAFPTLLSQDPAAPSSIGGWLVQGTFVALAGFIARRRDRRWKLIVSRRTVSGHGRWAVVDAALFENAEAADEARIDLLASWQPGQYEASFPLRGAQLKRLRRDPG